MILVLFSFNNAEGIADRSAVDDKRCLRIMEGWLVKTYVQ